MWKGSSQWHQHLWLSCLWPTVNDSLISICHNFIGLGYTDQSPLLCSLCLFFATLGLPLSFPLKQPPFSFLHSPYLHFPLFHPHPCPLSSLFIELRQHPFSSAAFHLVNGSKSDAQLLCTLRWQTNARTHNTFNMIRTSKKDYLIRWQRPTCPTHFLRLQPCIRETGGLFYGLRGGLSDIALVCIKETEWGCVYMRQYLCLRKARVTVQIWKQIML